MKRLRQKSFWLIIGNTLLWLGIGYFLLSKMTHLAWGGSILALLFGAWLIYYSLKRQSGGLDNPELARWLGLCFGFVALIGGIAGLVWLLQGGLPTQQQTIQARIEQARRLNSQHLDLARLDLTWIPPEVWELSELTTLSLDDNQLAVLPADLGRLTHLESLDLRNNHLTAVPREIGQLTHLTTLNLTKNQLSELPPEIGQLVALKSLELGWNQLAELPAEIGELANLESLSLQHNHLTALPAELGQLTSLKSLYVFNNDLTVLPPELAKLRQLQNLILDYNQLSALPDEIAQLANLKTLSLSGNRITELSPSLEHLAALGVSVKNDPRVDQSSILNSEYVLPLIFVLIAVLAFAFERWWGKWEATLARNQANGRAFRIPPFARGACILALLLIITVDVIVYSASRHPAQTAISPEAGLAVPLLLLPFVLISLYMLVHNSGVVILKADEIVLRRLGYEKRLAFQDVVNMDQWRLGLPPSLILTGQTGTLGIPRSIENWPQVYQTLQQQISKSRPLSSARFPYDLKIRASAVRLALVETGILLVMYLGIGLSGLWVPAVQGHASQAMSALVLLAITSLLFIPALVILVVGSIKPKQPSELTLTAKTIRFRYPRGEWQTWEVADLGAIELRPSRINLSVINLPVRIWETAVTYHLHFIFTGERRFVIDRDRARQFGIALEQLHTTLNQLYQSHLRRTA